MMSLTFSLLESLLCPRSGEPTPHPIYAGAFLKTGMDRKGSVPHNCTFRLLLVVVGNDDFAGDDFGFQFIGALPHGFGQELLVVLIDGIINALVGQPKTFGAAGEFAGLGLGDGSEDCQVHPLEHTGQDQAGFGPVLVRITANGELLPFLSGVEDAETGGACRGEDDVHAAYASWAFTTIPDADLNPSAQELQVTAPDGTVHDMVP